jgi:GT2 family glycosyltransferase
MGLFENGLMAVKGKDELGSRCTYISQCPAVGGALFMVRREAILQGWDEEEYIGFRGFDDLDMCLTMRKNNWEVLYCGYGSAIHIDSPTKRRNGNFQAEFEENKGRFMDKWNFVIR